MTRSTLDLLTVLKVLSRSVLRPSFSSCFGAPNLEEIPAARTTATTPLRKGIHPLHATLIKLERGAGESRSVTARKGTKLRLAPWNCRSVGRSAVRG